MTAKRLFSDPVDSAIVRMLQQDSRISNQQIASELDIAAGAVAQRIRKLEQGEFIRLVLVSDFESREALAAYQEHPAHKAVGLFVRAVVSERRLVDCETD